MYPARIFMRPTLRLIIHIDPRTNGKISAVIMSEYGLHSVPTQLLIPIIIISTGIIRIETTADASIIFFVLGDILCLCQICPDICWCLLGVLCAMHSIVPPDQSLPQIRSFDLDALNGSVDVLLGRLAASHVFSPITIFPSRSQQTSQTDASYERSCLPYKGMYSMLL